MRVSPYREIDGLISAIQHPQVHKDSPGQASGYTIWALRIGDERKPRILLSAGTHGDEPAGVMMLSSWLAGGHFEPWLNSFCFLALPCNNPYGFEHNTRENEQGLDLNRNFGEGTGCREAKLIRHYLDQLQPELTLMLDFHEDWESTGFYLYELAPSGRPYHHHVLDRIRPALPVNTSARIDGMPAQNGLMRPELRQGPPDPSRRGSYTALPLYVRHHFCDHSLTFETPTSFPLSQRTAGHRIALETCLKLQKRRSSQV